MKRFGVMLLVAVCGAGAALGQSRVRVPEASPKATVGQTVGITDISLVYHRPGVNNRRIWGGLVPYDVLWRAGANEPTLITVSTPVTVEGQPLAAGTYSFYILPRQSGPWTVVLNRFTGGWGTYSYDEKEDVLRVSATPQTAETSQERMLFTFDDPTATSTVLSMRWEKLRLPIKIEADTPKLTLASIRDELRSGKHWDAQAYAAAARYASRNGDMDSAMAWADRALELSSDYGTMSLKASLLEKKGDAAGAKALRDRAATVAPDYASLNPAYRLLGDKKYDEAAAWLTKYMADHPTSWRGLALLGSVYGEKGDDAKSKEAFDKAMSLARDNSERVEVQDSINDLMATKKP